MNLIVTPAWTTVEGPLTEVEVALLDRVLSYYQPGYFFTPQYRNGHWDGKVHLLYNGPKGTGFPSGVLPRVQKALDLDGYLYTVDDRRVYGRLPSASGVRVDGVTLRPDQIEAAATLLREHCGILNLATNFGKTEVAAALFRLLNRRGLFLLNRKGLARQTVKRFEARGVPSVGMIGDGVWSPGRTTVATVQTLAARMGERATREFLADIEVMIVDEAHTISPPSWFPVLSECPALIRGGLSATAKYKAKLLAIEAYIGPIIMEVDEASMIDAGLSARPLVEFEDIPYHLPVDLTWPTVYEEGVVYNAERNARIVELCRRYVAAGQRVLVLVYRIPHGELLRQELAGVPVQWLHGGLSSEAVDAGQRAFETGPPSVLVASGIFDMGRDIPAIEAFIHAAGWKDRSLTIQRIGRAIRRKPGENTVRVHDFWDGGHARKENGDHATILARQSSERWMTYELKGYQPRFARRAA